MTLRSGSRGGSENARGRATPTGNQQPQLQDPTPQRDGRIMWSVRAQGQEVRDRINEGARGVKKRKRPQKSYKRDLENGGGLGGRGKKHRQESVGSVYVDPEHVENRNEAGMEAQGTQALNKNCR